MANLSGTLNIFRALVQPRLIVPSLSVKSIRGLDFRALKEAGYCGAVFDKDNCLTIPYDDHLVPDLEEAWKECKTVFGEGNVLIVSNSAGTRSDPMGVQADSVAAHLGVPVLFHSTKKPGCHADIQRYFGSLPRPIDLTTSRKPPSPSPSSSPASKIIVVGDRLFTDVLLANRFGSGRALAVWTTGLWTKEALFLRALEKGYLGLVLRFRKWRNPGKELSPEELLLKKFVKDERKLLKHPASAELTRAWYTRAIISTFGVTSRGLRWAFRRLLEGKAARAERQATKASIEETLSARDPEMSPEHSALWRRLWSRLSGKDGSIPTAVEEHQHPSLLKERVRTREEYGGHHFKSRRVNSADAGRT